MKRTHLFLLVGLIIFVIIGLIVLYFATKPSSPGSNKKTNKSIDNSDVPCPPNSLEYNATYSPPKRNCNLESSSIIKRESVNRDIVNGSYISIPEDDDYTL